MFWVALIVVGCGWVAIKRLRAFQQANAVEKNLLNKNGVGEHCKKCDEDYFVCSVCGCQHKEEIDARRCYEWCLILKGKHAHKYLHDHEEES